MVEENRHPVLTANQIQELFMNNPQMGVLLRLACNEQNFIASNLFKYLSHYTHLIYKASIENKDTVQINGESVKVLMDEIIKFYSDLSEILSVEMIKSREKLERDAVSLWNDDKNLARLMLYYGYVKFRKELISGIDKIGFVDPLHVLPRFIMDKLLIKFNQVEWVMVPPWLYYDYVINGSFNSDEVKRVVDSFDLDKIATDKQYGHIVDEAIERAVSLRASDIHFEPVDDGLEIRLRVDGILDTLLKMPITYTSRVINLLKIRSNVSIAENRRPQDGRISQLRFGEKRLDIRVSFIPTENKNEKAVLRLLYADEKHDLEEIGLENIAFNGYSSDIEYLKYLVRIPQGLILISGPTGSGKTTTLYSMMQIMDREEKNVMTLEEPIEYHIYKVNQIAVNHEIGFGFAQGLRSVLRQDPDVIMVGEIRDKETASLAMSAAQTGHLVLSTIHTNDALGVITRLEDLEVLPHILSSSLVCAISQRLGRKVCHECSTIIPLDEAVGRLDIDPNAKVQYLNKMIDSYKKHGLLPNGSIKVRYVDSDGCEKCSNGYRGRIGFFEILRVDTAIQSIIRESRGDRKKEILDIAMNNGFRSIHEDAWFKVMDHKTTMEEVLRVLGLPEGI